MPDSAPVTFNTAGPYTWLAVYSGDGNNKPDTSDCSTVFTVNKATPTLAVAPVAPLTITVGESASASAAV